MRHYKDSAQTRLEGEALLASFSRRAQLMLNGDGSEHVVAWTEFNEVLEQDDTFCALTGDGVSPWATTKYTPEQLERHLECRVNPSSPYELETLLWLLKEGDPLALDDLRYWLARYGDSFWNGEYWAPDTDLRIHPKYEEEC